MARPADMSRQCLGFLTWINTTNKGMAPKAVPFGPAAAENDLRSGCSPAQSRGAGRFRRPPPSPRSATRCGGCEASPPDCNLIWTEAVLVLGPAAALDADRLDVARLDMVRAQRAVAPQALDADVALADDPERAGDAVGQPINGERGDRADRQQRDVDRGRRSARARACRRRARRMATATIDAAIQMSRLANGSMRFAEMHLGIAGIDRIERRFDVANVELRGDAGHGFAHMGDVGDRWGDQALARGQREGELEAGLRDLAGREPASRQCRPRDDPGCGACRTDAAARSEFHSA